MHPQPLLRLDESRLQHFDPQDPIVLGRFWSVFSKASSLLEDGERLRNLSWRLYSRETLCGDSHRRALRSNSDSSNASSTFSRASVSSEPELSRSVDSADSALTDDAAVVDSSCPQANERHTTPADFRHLVYSIKHKQILKPTPPPSRSAPQMKANQQPAALCPKDGPVQHFSPPPVNAESSTSTVATTATDSFSSTIPASETSVCSESSNSQHSVVRGFAPGTGVTSYTSKTQLAPQPAPAGILRKSPTSQHSNTITPVDRGNKKKGMFMLGGSSGEDDESFRDRMSPRCPTRPSQRTSDGSRKTTSFKDEVLVMRSEKDMPGSDWESDDDSAAVESAIEEDEDEWEDDESDHRSDDSKQLKFFRVDSKANLTSRRSALTLNLEEQRSGKQTGGSSTPTLRRSRTSTPNGPSIPASPTEESAFATASKMQNSKPIMTTSNMQPTPAIASPRTTRRHMLAGELSESLRRNMLSERSQKASIMPPGANMIRRANTANDVSRLGRVAEASEPTRGTNEGTSVPHDKGGRQNWNHYFDQGVGEFHQAGW